MGMEVGVGVEAVLGMMTGGMDHEEAAVGEEDVTGTMAVTAIVTGAASDANATSRKGNATAGQISPRTAATPGAWPCPPPQQQAQHSRKTAGGEEGTKKTDHRLHHRHPALILGTETEIETATTTTTRASGAYATPRTSHRHHQRLKVPSPRQSAASNRSTQQPTDGLPLRLLRRQHLIRRPWSVTRGPTPGRPWSYLPADPGLRGTRRGVTTSTGT